MPQKPCRSTCMSRGSRSSTTCCSQWTWWVCNSRCLAVRCFLWHLCHFACLVKTDSFAESSVPYPNPQNVLIAFLLLGPLHLAWAPLHLTVVWSTKTFCLTNPRYSSLTHTVPLPLMTFRSSFFWLASTWHRTNSHGMSRPDSDSKSMIVSIVTSLFMGIQSNQRWKGDQNVGLVELPDSVVHIGCACRWGFSQFFFQQTSLVFLIYIR